MLAGILVVFAAAAAALVLVRDPAAGGFYPACAFTAATGWECAGCGGLRAFHALLHGRAAEAWRFNPVLVLAAPVALWFLVNELRVGLGGRSRFWIVRPGKWLWVAPALLAVHFVIRNLR